MSCTSAVITGVAIECGNVGSIKKIYIANTADVATITYNVDGEVSGMTMVTGATFKSFNFRKGNASFTTNGTRDPKQGTYFAKTEIVAQFNKMQTSVRNEIMQLVKANTYVIITDYNGLHWFIGKDSYVELVTGSGQSGANMQDGNFYNIVLSSETVELPVAFADGILTSLIVDSLV